MRAGSPGADGTNSGSKPAYASTCSLPVKRAKCRGGYLPCQLGEYWHPTAGGSVEPHGRPSRTYVHKCPVLVFPVPGANPLTYVPPAFMLGAANTRFARAP